MSESRRGAEGLKSKGKILRMRMGINPNSSGYGILWGGLFFLSPTIIGSVVTMIIESRLERALQAYRAGKDTPEVKREWAMLVLWGLAWVCYFVGWLLLFQIIDEFNYLTAIFGGASILATIFIVYLARQCKIYLPFIKALGYLITILIGAALVGIIGFYTYGIQASGLIPGGLVLSLIVARYSTDPPRKWTTPLISIIYIVVGIILLLAFPYPPINLETANPIGLRFFLWGWGAPPSLTIWSLFRLKGKSIENKENPL